MHEVDVLDERSPQRLCHRLGAPILDQTPQDLVLHLGAQRLDSVLGRFARDTFAEGIVAASKRVNRWITSTLETVVNLKGSMLP